MLILSDGHFSVSFQPKQQPLDASSIRSVQGPERTCPHCEATDQVSQGPHGPRWEPRARLSAGVAPGEGAKGLGACSCVLGTVTSKLGLPVHENYSGVSIYGDQL